MTGARMPDYVSWDSQKNRAVYQRRFPKDVVALLGNWYRHKYPASLSKREAYAASFEQTAEFTALVDVARQTLADPVSRAEALTDRFVALVKKRNPRPRLAEMRGEIAGVLELLGRVRAGTEQMNDTAELYRSAARLGIVIPNRPTNQRVDSAAVLNAWIAERRNDGRVPNDRAVRNKRSKLARLFAWKSGADDLARMTRDEIAGHLQYGDLGDISESDARRYRLHLLEKGIAFDHLADVRALFGVAKRADLIKANPFAEIELPNKATNPRPPFETHEAAIILVAARQAKPWIKWFNLIAAYSGAIPSELQVLTTAEVYQKFGVWVLHIRPAKGGNLKSE